MKGGPYTNKPRSYNKIFLSYLLDTPIKHRKKQNDGRSRCTGVMVMASTYLLRPHFVELDDC